MFIFLLMICLLTGCKTSEKKQAEESKEPVKISIILTVDPSTGMKNEQKVVEAFNKKYKGTYELDVDWIVETENDYRQNLKRLNATDELPDIITDLRMLPSFYQKMIAENRIMDLHLLHTVPYSSCCPRNGHTGPWPGPSAFPETADRALS